MAPKYILNRRTNERYYIDGFTPLTEEEYNQLMERFRVNYIHQKEVLPRKVDLRGKMTPIEQQQRTNSCTAHALAGAFEFLLKKKFQRDLDISRLFVYYNARLTDASLRGMQLSQMSDGGCSITGGVNSLRSYGVCPENLWPFEPTMINYPPDQNIYQSAKQEAVKWKPFQVPIELNAMKSTLAKGYPFAFGIALFQSINNVPTGYVPQPQPGESAATSHSRHAMLAVGYNDDEQVFIVRNSWGTNWGRNGYCFLPYNYLANPQFTSDAWALCSVLSNNASADGDNFGGGEDGGDNDDDDEGAEEEDLFEEDDVGGDDNEGEFGGDDGNGDEWEFGEDAGEDEQ